VVDQKRVRCAIYTRKSSEEGLEQSFNSLHAQREACEAFIISQRHEGWHAISKHYDDGGFSGGNIERPALTDLLADIDQGKVDTVVVYKVDRLTRSLSDFAKIIERFDQRTVSFVSVTQQFNTTSSMGRLTLNVLLSFAQFEREVTGERIRDKIAASKRKGMWMGGIIPLGYDLKDRLLIVNESEAKTVRKIFDAYLRLKCVSELKSHLDRNGIKSKGGSPFSRGALYHLLRNRLYIGEIPHKGQGHKGQHDAIIKPDVWQRVDSMLKANIQGEPGLRATAPSLAGLLFDEEGNRYTPTHSTKGGKRYRYYTSQGVIRKDRNAPSIKRVPAHALEQLLIQNLSRWLESPECKTAIDSLLGPKEARQILRTIRDRWSTARRSTQLTLLSTLLTSITITPNSITAEVSLRGIAQAAGVEHPGESKSTVTWPASFGNGSGAHIEHAHAIPGQPSAALLKMIVRARSWADDLVAGRAKSLSGLSRDMGINRRYTARVLKACVLAPDLIEAALQGRQSPKLTAQRLIMMGNLPLCWQKQRELFGRNPI
jgi:site-specific DNA recombinase